MAQATTPKAQPVLQTQEQIDATIAAAAVASAGAAAELKALLPNDSVTDANGKIMAMQYRVINDGIVGGDDTQALGHSIMTGLVTRDMIENSGADFAWLIKIGAIEEAGYA